MIADADEQLHRADPAVWSWNESWLFSFIDLDGGPAYLFRVGILPNQRRAMLWSFLHVPVAGDPDGEWLAIEESRLHGEDLATDRGIAYDKWALRFGWEPEVPFERSRFTFAAEFLARSGPRAGSRVPVTIDVVATASMALHPTGTGDDSGDARYPKGRFEQSLAATGTVTVDGAVHPIRAGAHRDKSWGPRDWKVAFTIGDLQAEDRQLYYVGQQPGRGSAYVSEGGESRRLSWTGGDIGFDDSSRTITSARLELAGSDGASVEVDMRPIGKSVCFDMAHTCETPEHWLYFRTLVEATVTGWAEPCRGWFEASRYGVEQGGTA